MLKNYFKITVRNLIKFKTYLLVNVFGLSLGLACTSLAVVFVLEETSFDDFHSKSEQIFRVNKYSTNDAGITSKSAESSGMMGPQMLTDYPEVKAMVRFQPWFNGEVVSYENQHFKEEDLAFADSAYFNFFDFELLEGNPNTVLKAPRSIVLTTSLKNRIFEKKDAVGEFLQLFGLTFQVTGIAADVPSNSHMQFSALISWSTTTGGEGNLNYTFFNNWLAQALNTYVELKPQTDVSSLETKLVGMMETYMPSRSKDYELYLQPFTDIYLHSDDIQFGNFKLRLGSNQFVLIFKFIAFFVLLIAVINYVNISTSKAMRRGLEVGVRKVLGAERNQLFFQFMGEAFIITLISGAVAMLFVDISIPYFNAITDRHLNADLLLSTNALGLILVVFLVTSLLAGAYPALVLSAFKPSTILKPGKGKMLQGGRFRQGMIVFQFFLATLMITSAIVVKTQNQFLLDYDLGVDSEQVVVVELQGEAPGKAQFIQQEILKHPDILNSVTCPTALTGGSFGTTVIPEGFNDELDIRYFRVGYEFIDVYGIEMIEGRGFDKSLTTDRNAVVINETMAKFLGWETAVGKMIRFGENAPEVPVIGVTKDFNFFGPNKNEIQPLVMNIEDYAGNLSVRLSGNNTASALNFIKEVYAEVEEKYPFEYTFVDDYFARQYSSEQNFLSIVTVFSIMSIVISCLGLYGLVSYFIEQRVKEIGIRKVLGASIANIALLINGYFLRLIGISLLISVPFSFWLMNEWLGDFVNRINLGIWPFIMSGALITLIALVTTNNQALKASKRNPVQSLKYE